MAVARLHNSIIALLRQIAKNYIKNRRKIAKIAAIIGLLAIILLCNIVVISMKPTLIH